jgi:hypothetical protein
MDLDEFMYWIVFNFEPQRSVTYMEFKSKYIIDRGLLGCKAG